MSDKLDSGDTAIFDPELIRRYDTAGPRYTSYPTAVQFSDGFGIDDYRAEVDLSNDEPIPRALSLYFHIPFCSTLCFYCACNKIVTKRKEKAKDYLVRLYREIELQGRQFDPDRPVTQLHFGGGTPTFLSSDQFESLLAQISRHFHLVDHPERDYAIEIDPRTIDQSGLIALRSIGFNRISMGVQDFDEAVQEAVHRIQPQSETLDLLKFANEIGFESTNLDLIYGLPMQTVESFNRTLDAIIDASPDRLSVFNYAHLPQMFSPQTRIKEEDLPSPEEKLRILQSTVTKLSDAGYTYIGMDHFAKPDDKLAVAQRDGTLHRNFQGYSTHADCDLVGMGVSAISKVHRCYCQNEKDLEPYYASLDKDRLPIARGITLTEDDELRRRVIERLMCFGHVDLAAEQRRAGVAADYFNDELARLEPLASDGLVKIEDGTEVTVTPRGRYLLRNICMEFDNYLKASTRQKRYSRVI